MSSVGCWSLHLDPVTVRNPAQVDFNVFQRWRILKLFFVPKCIWYLILMLLSLIWPIEHMFCVCPLLESTESR